MQLVKTLGLDGNEILALQQRWDRIRIANLYDTLDKMGYPNQCIDLDIRPLFPGQHLAGVAVTVRGSRSAIATQQWMEQEGIQGSPATSLNIQEHLFPGSVVVIDGGGEKWTGKMGEMTSWRFKQAGAKGIVIDGYTRDRLGLEMIPDYCTCARGTTPVESSKRWHVNAVNVPIALQGTLSSQVPVYPGDWVIGGPDGVMIVPQSIADETLLKAEEIEKREAGMRQDLAAGMTFEQAYEKWGRA
jgi:regulator of RNase E activity RraA